MTIEEEIARMAEGTYVADADHSGETYDAARDRARLNAQQERVFNVVRDEAWWLLAEISEITGDPEASVSARLRDFRKPRFGGFTVDRRYVGRGLHEYRLRGAQ